jgi:hypothetical protein
VERERDGIMQLKYEIMGAKSCGYKGIIIK